MDIIQEHTSGNELKGLSSVNNLRGDANLACAALKLARHVRTRGLRPGSEELVGLVVELIEFAQGACESAALMGSPAGCMHVSERNFQDQVLYAESLVMLARDVGAHPWGAFGITHPAKYLPFLQQLAGDLTDH